MRDGKSNKVAQSNEILTSTTSGSDNSAARIQRLARAVGNDEIAQRIRRGDANRDEMLAYVAARLLTVREAQLREFQQTERGANWPEWRDIADRHKPEISKPEPTQWRPIAQAYHEAALTLCQGDLALGRRQLEVALALEQQTLGTLTTLVDRRDLDPAEAPQPGWLQSMVEDTPRSGSCRPPTEIEQLVDRIVDTTRDMPTLPNRRRSATPWWTEDVDDEEDDDGGNGTG